MDSMSSRHGWKSTASLQRLSTKVPGLAVLAFEEPRFSRREVRNFGRFVGLSLTRMRDLAQNKKKQRTKHETETYHSRHCLRGRVGHNFNRSSARSRVERPALARSRQGQHARAFNQSLQSHAGPAGEDPTDP